MKELTLREVKGLPKVTGSGIRNSGAKVQTLVLNLELTHFLSPPVLPFHLLPVKLLLPPLPLPQGLSGNGHLCVEILLVDQ